LTGIACLSPLPGDSELPAGRQGEGMRAITVPREAAPSRSRTCRAADAYARGRGGIKTVLESGRVT